MLAREGAGGRVVPMPGSGTQGGLADERRGGLGLARRLARGALLLALLLAPAAALEVWARGEAGLIPYFEDGYRYQLESKKLMFERVGCPASVAMGTSITEVSLNATTIAPYAAQAGDRRFAPVFTFAAPGTRPLAMLGLWRWLEDQGCTPQHLFVEATPIILNLERGEDFERAFMDWRMQRDIPAERFAAAPYTWRLRVDLATWWRWFAYRNREPIVQYLEALAGRRKPLPPVERIPPDGLLHVTSTRKLEGAALTSHYQEIKGQFDRGEFRYGTSPAYHQALLLLVEEARAAGTRVVLHTPPVPGMLHEFMDRVDATGPFCDFYRRALANPGVRWYSEYGREVPLTEFSDWLHLNRQGAAAYAPRLLAAVAADAFPVDDYCGGR
jgi:hypothetical protein